MRPDEAGPGDRGPEVAPTGRPVSARHRTQAPPDDRTGPGPEAVVEHLRADRRAADDQVTALSRDRAEIVEAAELVATDDEHDPEGHTIAWERQQVAALLDAARTRRDDLDGALARWAEGTYGACTACGAPIGRERLSVLPATATCVACAP